MFVFMNMYINIKQTNFIYERQSVKKMFIALAVFSTFPVFGPEISS